MSVAWLESLFCNCTLVVHGDAGDKETYVCGRVRGSGLQLQGVAHPLQ